MASSFKALCLALLFGFLSPWCVAGDAPAGGGDLIARVKAAGVLRVAQVGVDQPPFFWRRDDGTWVGYEIDLAKDIADRLGVRLEMVRLGGDYNEVCAAVHDGRADLGLSNLSDTPARRKIVDFTEPYIYSRVAMLVDLEGLEKANIGAIEPKDLNRPDAIGAVTEESAYEFVYDELMPLARKLRVPQGTFEEITRPVIEGKAHFIIDDGLTMNLGMRNHPEYSPRYYLHVFDEYNDPLSMCVPKGEAGMLEFLNGVIGDIEKVEPVTLEYLVDKYMK